MKDEWWRNDELLYFFSILEFLSCEHSIIRHWTEIHCCCSLYVACKVHINNLNIFNSLFWCTQAQAVVLSLPQLIIIIQIQIDRFFLLALCLCVFLPASIHCNYVPIHLSSQPTHHKLWYEFLEIYKTSRCEQRGTNAWLVLHIYALQCIV